MRRSMLSLSASRSEAGVTGVVESSEADGKPLTCTAGRVGAAMLRESYLPSARSWQIAFSVKDERVGRPAAPNSAERRLLAIGNDGSCGDGREMLRSVKRCLERSRDGSRMQSRCWDWWKMEDGRCVVEECKKDGGGLLYSRAVAIV